MKYRILLLLLVPLYLAPSLLAAPEKVDSTPLPGTRPLTMSGDISSQMIEGIDRFLLKQIDAVSQAREKRWSRDFASPEAFEKSITPNRTRLAHILGVRDLRVPFESPELVGTTKQPALIGKGVGYEVFRVRWPAFADVHGEGLLLIPTTSKPSADIIAIPDADITPEALVGLVAGVKPEAQYARRLAESGCRVLVPVLIDRTFEARAGRAKMTSREFLYRSAFELGRHLIGYEIQKVLAGVDWFAREGSKKIGVIGWGEGGLLALHAAALDPRIQAVCVSGYFGQRTNIWQEPIERNVFGLLEEFGDAELAAMLGGRSLIVEAAQGPVATFPSQGGAPSRLVSPEDKEVTGVVNRARELIKDSKWAKSITQTGKGDLNSRLPGSSETLSQFLQVLGESKLAPLGEVPTPLAKEFDPKPRQARQFHEIDRHNQALLEESPYVRQKFMSKLDTSSPEKFKTTQQGYRDYFANEVIGTFDIKREPFNPRSRKLLEHEKWTAYEVVLDVFPDVFAYGLLLIPKGIKEGERRPVVVCQHGLEGRPIHCVNEMGQEGYGAYKAFAARLAERGFITFAPQNLYLFRDRFRTLQRKANPIKKTLFSVIIPQHQQITDWLKTLPMVDGKRIGFYGLSYGGKSAMRIPPLVDNYCLSICSADFNDWVWKNASSRSTYSYVWTMEYEIFEFDLGSTFNYSEMAALIAPRPFMVERGHFDGVAPDERVALEFAKVRHLYQAKLGLGDRTTIEWFVGPHTINGKGTFEFLHKHLDWPAK